MAKKNISQRDIAQILGVNASTVSRALKGMEGVSPDLREKIISLAKEYSYRPNPFAMSLRYDSTRMIGIVVPDLSFSYIAHIVKSIEESARKAGYMCIITDSGEKYEAEVECVEHLESLHVEGIIICPSQETTDFEYLKRLRERHIPLVLFERSADVDCSAVTINDAESARQATLHLIAGGARRIAFLGGPNAMKQTVERKHGYLEALREHNIAISRELVKCSDLSYNSGLTDTLELLSLPDPPNAILAAQGKLAISAFQAIISRGLHVPDDVAIIGFMSDWVSGMTDPRMTFIKQNVREIGRKAFKILEDQIVGDDRVKNVIVNARLEIRESTKKV